MLNRLRQSVVGLLAAALIWSSSAVADDSAPVLSDPDGFYSAALLEVSQNEDDVNDPLESVNRLIFDFNDGLQENFLRPIVTAYNEAIPEKGRQAVKNVFNNISEPITLVNDLLQFEFERAVNTFLRAMINTVFGAGGIMNLAGDMGLESHSEDFGQTLAVWGVGEGLYLVLPVLGPSNPRDAVGRFLIDSYFDPLGIYLDNIDEDEINLAIDAVDGVLEYADVVEELDQIRKTSVDYYAAIRSLYRQKRRAEISNGQNIDLPPIPDISPEFRGDLPLPGSTKDPVASLSSPTQ